MKKKKTLAGLYSEKSIIGSKAKIKSSPVFEDFNYILGIDSEHEFTISEIKYRIDQDGNMTPVFTLKELKQSPNLRFKADQLWITETCGCQDIQYMIWIGTGNILSSSLSFKNLTPYPITPLKKTGIEYTEGNSVIILIPKNSTLVARKDDGFGKKVEFDEIMDDPMNEDSSGIKIGYNGEVKTISGQEYKVYGQVFLNSGTCYIYID
jgi:hypothetical protein